MHETQKELLPLAIKKRSQFTFDIVRWILRITRLLLAVSNAPACRDHDSDELRKSALELISVLSCVPDDQEAVVLVENCQLAEPLFEVAIDAHRCGCDEMAIKIRDLLFSWTFKAGKHQTEWGVFEEGCAALVCFNIIADLDDATLVQAISDRLQQEDAPSAELRSRAAFCIRKKLQTNIAATGRCGVRSTPL